MYMITIIQNIRDERDNFYVHIRKLNERGSGMEKKDDRNSMN